MNILDVMKLYVYESGLVFDDCIGIIETLESCYENNDLDNFIKEMYQILPEPIEFYLEKKTREEYAVRRFKKKYDYNPSDNTITLDGKKYRVNLKSYKQARADLETGEDKDVKVPSYKGQRNPVGIDADTLNLNRDFFKLKNNRRRDAIMAHEGQHGTGQGKREISNLVNDYANPAKENIDVDSARKISDKIPTKHIRWYRGYRNSYERSNKTQEDRDKLYDRINRYYHSYGITPKQDDFMAAADEYLGKRVGTGGHLYADELDADMKAYQKYGKHIYRGTRELVNKDLKDLKRKTKKYSDKLKQLEKAHKRGKIDKSIIDKYKSKRNINIDDTSESIRANYLQARKDSDIELTTRSKAMKNKKLRKLSRYKDE